MRTPFQHFVWALGLWLLLMQALAGGQEGAATPPELSLNLEPILYSCDPGPEVLAGAERGFEQGERFLWAGITLEGGAPFVRLYFDRLDNEHFHFLDRRVAALTLGLCEGGIELVLARATLDPASSAGLRLARLGTQVGVFQGMRLVLSAFDDRLTGGSIGLRRLEGGKPSDKRLENPSDPRPGEGLPTLKVEKHEDVHFVDEFMRTEKDASSWRKVNCVPDRADFQIRSLRHPLLSANAFNYMGAGERILSVVGSNAWDNYRFEASLRGPKDGQIGLVFAYQDEKNYGLFRWSARASRARWPRHFRIQRSRTRRRRRGPLVQRRAPQTDRARSQSSEPEQNSLHALMKQHAVFDDVKVEGGKEELVDQAALSRAESGSQPT